jgi:peptidoglycan/LPS O-acetylase OafA/YrhL
MTTVLLVSSAGIDDRWGDGWLLPAGFALLEQVNTWIWVLVLLGAGRALLGAPVRGLRYAGEASFPFYVLHQTVIVAVAYVVVAWDLAVWQKFAIVCLAATALTLLLYEVAVRRTNPTRWLFGMRPLRREPRPTAPVPVGSR